jgi:hypothetical protein
MKFSKIKLKVNDSIHELVVAIILLFFSFIISSCSDEDNYRDYYQGTFKDEIEFTSALDSTNIVFEQLAIVLNIKENIPYSISNDSSLSDTIKFKLFVSFGSYDQHPEVIKETNQINDSVYVWYSTRNKFYKSLSKSFSISEPDISPVVEFVSVDSIVVYKAGLKFIKLFSRIIK